MKPWKAGSHATKSAVGATNIVMGHRPSPFRFVTAQELIHKQNGHVHIRKGWGGAPTDIGRPDGAQGFRMCSRAAPFAIMLRPVGAPGQIAM